MLVKRTMSRFCRIVALLLAATLVHSQNATGEDEIADGVEAARFLRLSKIGAATETLQAAIDTKLRDVANTGNLANVKAIRDEKLAFINDGVLPTSEALSPAVDAYLAARKQASIELVVAYRAAVKRYTQQLNIEQADALDKKLKQFIQHETKVLNRAAVAPDRAASKVETAKETFKAEVQASRRRVTETLQSLARSATQRGRKDQAEAYQKVLKHFDTNGDLPESKFIPVQQARQTLLAELKAAQDKLATVYQSAIRHHEQASQTAEANRLKAELKQIVENNSIPSNARPAVSLTKLLTSGEWIRTGKEPWSLSYVFNADGTCVGSTIGRPWDKSSYTTWRIDDGKLILLSEKPSLAPATLTYDEETKHFAGGNGDLEFDMRPAD